MCLKEFSQTLFTFDRMNIETIAAGINEITDVCSQRMPSNSMTVGMKSDIMINRLSMSSLRNVL